MYAKKIKFIELIHHIYEHNYEKAAMTSKHTEIKEIFTEQDILQEWWLKTVMKERRKGRNLSENIGSKKSERFLSENKAR